MHRNPIDLALSLASAGKTEQACTLLADAGAQGSAEAWMQLAVWYLIGAPVPRDLDRARTCLAKAVAIGHVDGALMEIALLANGNGGQTAPDWPRALRALDIAAQNDPVAAAQRALLANMALRPDGTPLATPVGEILHDAPRLQRFPRLLTPEECAHLATTAQPLLEPSFVLDPRSGRPMPHPIRTSDGGAIGPTREDLVVRAINLRIAAATGTDVQNGEPLTVLRYAPGQQYRRHLDTIAGAANQRMATLILYLNQGFAGGETSFPAIGVTVQPRAGDAILFETLLPDGSPDPQLVHSGEPVRAGAKWIATRWIRQAPVDPWTLAAG
ncbi:proline hydroxylase [Sphingomonas sp. ABOLE]|uniref:2OG-Fe(II) oxygenase n=1 Tax=Sphingomonas sp. ABOLE TaxID=1985878 RepID=UPI000F7DFFE2|nr:2OG-Fe(II) oxygenase [Sphingomonas sp. ABOLE]RSV45290.1 proline hydroxylase [Sphingomonas sp. ABOLE]